MASALLFGEQVEESLGEDAQSFAVRVDAVGGEGEQRHALEPEAVVARRDVREGNAVGGRELPQENIPGTLVCIKASVKVPLVRSSSKTPAVSAISFSGIKPTERTSASHSIISSVPGIGFIFPSIRQISTASNLRLPIMREIVWLHLIGMP